MDSRISLKLPQNGDYPENYYFKNVYCLRYNEL